MAVICDENKVILCEDLNSICIILHYISDQRNLGMSMKVERSTVDQVRKRFETNKKKREEKKKEYDFEERMKELKEEVKRKIIFQA